MRGRGPGEAQEEAQGETLTVHEEAQDLTSKFMSLSSDALTLQCQQLENARHSGKQQWMEKQGFFEGLSKMCAALAEKDTQKVAQVAHQEKAKMTMVEEAVKKRARHTASQSIALGCTSLLKAKNNGKMEWFETQGWYQKALKMCTGLSGKGPAELEPEVKLTGREEYERDMKNKKPLELLEETCKQLSKLERDDAVQKTKWFPEAQQMCVTVKSASPGELKSLVDRQATRAETASGQLIKKTCENIKKDFKAGGMRKFEDTTWMPTVMAMCQKMGTRKVDGKQLKQRCEYIKKAQEEGKDKSMREKAWYGHLLKTCDWLWKKQKAFHQGPDSPIVTV